jgi:type 1 glutamine amidotransferase
MRQHVKTPPSLRLVATIVLASLSLASCTVPVARSTPSVPDHPSRIVYQGSTGPGVGKHIVLIAGDHEYRSEELLPALGRILARHHGFKVTVLFTLDSAGFIQPGSSNIGGLEALKTADLLVLAIRFQDFPAAEMQHVVDYLDRGGPVFGLRTSTHAFRITGGPYARYSWDYKGADYLSGFGEQVLGETWVGHYGTNHEQSSRVLPRAERASHPILRGVRDIHVQSGGYQAYPAPGSDVLAVGQVLNGMAASSAPDASKEQLPVVWTRTYRASNGMAGRVFTSTHGASEDLLNPGFRRMLVNAAFWTLGMEQAITSDLDIAFVGPFHPVTFAFDGYRRRVRPSDLAGWDAPIMSPDHPTRDAVSRPSGANAR